MSLKNKKVLVTGTAGFIGSHVVDRIIQESPASIMAVDNLFLGTESNLADARKRFDVQFFCEDVGMGIGRFHPDVVFHLAVMCLPISLTKPKVVYEMNTAMAVDLCELLRLGCIGTLIHVSSSEAYGTAAQVPMNESHHLDPRTPYAASKAACDHLVLSYCKTFGTDAAIVRPFNTYGPRQNSEKYAGLIPQTISRILHRQPPVIHGDGKHRRDWSYVTEVADAIVRAYSVPETRGQVINIASGQDASVTEVVSLIQKSMGDVSVPEMVPPRPGDVRRMVGDISLARRLLGHNPQVSMEEGLRRTIDWYRKAYEAAAV